jgi:hypothetical protein
VPTSAAGGWGAGLFFCTNTPGVNPQLFDPTFGGALISYIVSTINGHGNGN